MNLKIEQLALILPKKKNILGGWQGNSSLSSKERETYAFWLFQIRRSVIQELPLKAFKEEYDFLGVKYA